MGEISSGWDLLALIQEDFTQRTGPFEYESFYKNGHKYWRWTRRRSDRYVGGSGNGLLGFHATDAFVIINGAPLKTPFWQSARPFTPTFAYKNLEIHTVFLRFVTQNLKRNFWAPARN